MAREMKCGNCGAKNPLTSVFCIECGKKIDFSNLKPADLDESSPRGPVALLLKVIRLAVSLAIIGGAGLTLWPRSSEAVVGDEAAMREGRLKLRRLHDVAENGSDFKGALSEAEINAYLVRKLEMHREKVPEADRPVDVEAITVDIGAETATVLAEISWHGVKVTYLLEGVPQAGEGGFTVDAKRAEVGHLRFPSVTKGFVVNRLAKLFERMDDERLVFDKAKAFKLKDEELWIKLAGN